jgi:hypothetical protein
MTGPVIDRLVTPAGMRAALVAKRDQALTKAAGQAASALRVPDDPVIVRRGFSEFLSCQQATAKPWTRVQTAWAFVEAERRGVTAEQVIATAPLK